MSFKLPGTSLERLEGEQFMSAAPEDLVLQVTLYYSDDLSSEQEGLFKKFYQDHSLEVLEEDASHTQVQASCKHLKEAFEVELNIYQLDDKAYLSYEGEISLPDFAEGLVFGVLGLDALAHITRARPHADATQEYLSAYLPDEVAAYYGFPDNVASSQCIAVIELGGGFLESDIEAFHALTDNSTYKKVAIVNVDKAVGDTSVTPDDVADVEVTLDIEIIVGIAHQAQVVVYYAQNTEQSFNNAILKAINDTTYKPSVISISWGGLEVNWTSQAMKIMDRSFSLAATKGITVTAASGDTGSSNGLSNGIPHVDFPASSPWVLACGGTTITGSVEVVWNNDSGASGGGISTTFPRPEYQYNTPAIKGPTGQLGRGVPDVAGLADPQRGYVIVIGGQELMVGGTSAVAPLWAALVAQVNQARGSNVGFINPKLYAHPELFKDVAHGNNGTYQAYRGWDACTGLGSPNGAAIYKYFLGH
jgi:kumamolisin